MLFKSFLETQYRLINFTDPQNQAWLSKQEDKPSSPQHQQCEEAEEQQEATPVKPRFERQQHTYTAKRNPELNEHS